MPYFTVRDGKIQTIKLEYNLVSHCNYSCSDCAQLAPYSPIGFSSLPSFVRDLQALQKVYHVRRFRFLGGEPFLQKDIVKYIRAVRESGIADRIEVCTNGSLIQKVEDSVFREIDLLSVSWYPDPRCDKSKIRLAQHKCKQFDVKLKLRRTDYFWAMNVDRRIEDGALVDEIFRSCQVAHTWHCQTFSQGRFYLCSRPLQTGAYLKLQGQDPPDFRALDGVALHGDGLSARLQRFLSQQRVPESCRYCLGTVGKKLPWRSLSTSERRNPPALARELGETINRKRMHYLLRLAGLERVVLRVLPSLRVFRGLTLFKNLTTGD